MSFLTALKGFGAWVAKEFAKVYSAAPTIEKVADTTLAYAAPALQIILGALDPPAAAIAGPVIAEVQKSLHVASGLIYDFGASPTAASILAATTKDLQGLLDAGHIKDTALQGKITLVVNTIDGLVQSLAAAAPSAPVPAPPAPVA